MCPTARVFCALWSLAERQPVLTWASDHFQKVRELDWERITALLSLMSKWTVAFIQYSM